MSILFYFRFDFTPTPKSTCFDQNGELRQRAKVY